MRIRHTLGFIVLSALLAAGCGGGGNSKAGAPVGTEFSFGDFIGRAAISNPPVSSSSQGALATAFMGTFSSLKIRELNPSLSETRIFAASDAFPSGVIAGYTITSYAVDGSDQQQMTFPGAGLEDFLPSAGSNGKVVFQRAATLISSGAIMQMNFDGTSLVTLVPNGAQPSCDRLGDRVAFINGSNVNVVNTSTKAITNIPLPPNSGIQAVAMSPEGNTVYVILNVSGNYYVYSFPSDGSNGTELITILGIPVLRNDLAISPDGTEMAIILEGSPAQLVRFGTQTGAPAQPINLPSDGTGGVTYSPDGKYIVACTATGAVEGLYEIPIEGGSWTRLTQDTAGTFNPAWTPFIKDRTLISGGGGLLGTRACGVIFGQRAGGGTSSVLAFDVTTPSSVVMTAQPVDPFSVNNLTFSIDADSIIKLAYANTSNWRGIRAIGSGTPVTSASGALVSVSGVDGSVLSVLPFSGTRAAGSRPTVTDSGSIRTFSGSFLAVYDKDGKNLAPNGATLVNLDMKTGTLTVER